MNNPEAVVRVQENFSKGGINEITMREGFQVGVDVELTVPRAMAIVEYGNRIHVDRLEMPNPVSPGMDVVLRAVSACAARPPVAVHVRNTEQDVEAAVFNLRGKRRDDWIHILTTVDKARIKGDPQTYLDLLEKNIRRIRGEGFRVGVSVEHTTDMMQYGHTTDVMQVFHLADDAGAGIVGFADTRGIAYPWEIQKMISEIARTLRHAQVKGHFHNDYGMATINGITALLHGAAWVDVSAGGFGDRLGATALSQFFSALYGLDPALVKRYNVQLVTEYERFVADMFGIPLSYNLPTSEYAFSHHAGIHVREWVNGKGSIYEPHPPEVVGNQRRFILGTAISGRTKKEEVEIYCRSAL